MLSMYSSSQYYLRLSSDFRRTCVILLSSRIVLNKVNLYASIFLWEVCPHKLVSRHWFQCFPLWDFDVSFSSFVFFWDYHSASIHSTVIIFVKISARDFLRNSITLIGLVLRLLILE